MKSSTKRTLPPAAAAPSATAPAPDWPLRALVFVAGFVLMGFEIAGSRVLAPFFGNSVYVWGSLIGIVLGALGLGYWWGGRIADRWPSRRVLGTVGVAAAAGVFLVPYIGPPLCGAISGRGWEEKDRWGPVLASAALFLFPGVLLGVVSPFAIRLQARAVETVGRTAGMLYALSTVGSFAGTFITTFVLIPSIGTSWILKLLAGAMAVASALTLATGVGAAITAAAALVAAGLGAVAPVPAAVGLQPGEKILFEAETPYHHLFVVEDSFNARALQFNHYKESGIRLEPPAYPSDVAYTGYFHVIPAFTGPLRRVCFIGAGGGIGPREFLREYPGAQIDCVDIDPAVLEVCQDLFFVPRGDPRLRMIPADGRQFLRRAGEGPYNAIVLDAFTVGGRIPFHLTTREFFREARERLTPEGVFLMNAISALGGPRGGIYRAVHRTLAEAFEDGPGGAPRHVFALDVHGGPETRTRNVIFVATRAPADYAAARKRAADLVAAGALPAAVPGRLGGRVELEPDPAATLLTDDYAPIETMPF